jgi:hypothetical protein
LTQDSLEWREWCCLSCRRIRHTVAFIAQLGACEHGKVCAWGQDKWDGQCSPSGVASESLYGRTDPPLVQDTLRWPHPFGVPMKRTWQAAKR